MALVAYAMAATARNITDRVLGVRSGESVLVLTDSDCPVSVTEALAFALGAAGAHPLILTMEPHTVGGQEPAAAVAAALHAVDAAILQDSYALFHTDAVRDALRAGVRTVDMWGTTEDMMLHGGLLADHAALAQLTRRVDAVMRTASEVTLTTEEGTDLRLSLAGRPTFPLVADATSRGGHAGLPAGEVAVSPVPGSAQGVIVDPYVLERKDIAYRSEPFRMEIRDGRAVQISGGREAQVVAAMVEESGESARNIAEFALGTNRWCRLGVSLREVKKALGTAHVAIGDSMSLGGEVNSPLHMDMIFRRPTVRLDGRPILDRGRLLLD